MNEPAGSGADIQAKIQLLASLEIFASLTPAELAAVGRHSRWLAMPRGGSLYGTGAGAVQDGGRLYAIQEGEVLISKPGDEGRDISLATFVAGESFGELSLFDHQPGETTARCEEDSVLLAFPGPEGDEAQRNGASAHAGTDADRFFAAHPAIGAKVLHSLLAVVARRIRSTNRLIAEKSPWVQELRRQVSLDKLTGLFNASFLEEELARMVDEEGRRVCLLMLKPDNFKTVNDTYGHQAGDRALQLMAAALRSQLGAADSPGGPGTALRYRGDVLAAVLPEAELRSARALADRIRRAMSGIDLGEITGGEPLSITVSLGVAVSRQGPRGGAAALVEQAYGNLFTARNRGGDRVCAARSGGAR